MARWQIPVVLGAVVVGTAVGTTFDVGATAERLVVPALVALLVLTFAGVSARGVAIGLGANRRVVGLAFGLNFLWTPVLAGLLGWVLLSGHPDLRLGLVMLLVTPCTDWYLVFTGAARGNVEVAAALLPPNLVLQLVLLPVFIAVLTGTAADHPLADLVSGVAVVLGFPLAAAAIVRVVAVRAGEGWRLDALLERAEPVGLALLAVAITAVFAAHAPLVVDEPGAFVRLLIPLLAFFVIAWSVAGAASAWSRFAHPERVTLTMTTMARNSPVALAVAAAAFPDRPLVVVALAVGPLVELPVLAVVAARFRSRA